MISIHPQEGKLRAADNLLPRADGVLYARPGAVQVYGQAVTIAFPWGNNVIMHSNGRLILWANGETYDLGIQGHSLNVAPYQALIGDALREDRLYVADGLNPLWYLRWNGTTYEKVSVINSLVDDQGVPYPLPIPRLIENWNNRLWISDGTNRIQHCQNENPEEWDPLWTLEFQGEARATVKAMTAHSDNLLVALDNSLWQVAGTSQYNWSTNQALNTVGAIGPQALVSDGVLAAIVSKHGLHLNGDSTTISDDLRDLFLVSQVGAKLCIEPKRRLLMMQLSGRLFIMHLENPGLFTEIAREGLMGPLVLLDGWGFYGYDGLWIFGRLNIPDQSLGDENFPVIAKYDTWEVHPNLGGGGRALLNRVRFGIAGQPGAVALYQATADDSKVFWYTVHLSDDTPAPWGQVPYVESQTWSPRTVWREAVPRLAGVVFRHTLTCNSYVEIKSFLPEYRFGLPVVAP